MDQEMGSGQTQMPRVKLGSQGLEVSKLGFGCMGLTGVYNAPLDDEAGVAVILSAFDHGVTFFDTSDVYGPLTNETLLGKALKRLPREKVQVATKFGIAKIEKDGVVVKGSPEYVRASCEASLQRLGIDYIDLYYQHRVDTSIPIEETIGEMKKLVHEGKVKYIGLSEASPDTIRRAHAVHPISALQIEWSLWTRDVEETIIPLCRELNIGIVLYTPLGHGFFAGKAVLKSLPENSSLATHPRFSEGNIDRNKTIYECVRVLADELHCTPAQLALAWVFAGNDVSPIPGTTKIKNLEHTIGSLRVKLTEDELKRVSEAVPGRWGRRQKICPY